MGYASALGMAQQVQEGNITLDSALSWHFSANCYPPVPQAMIEPALAAIAAVQDGDANALVALPNGVTYKDGRASIEAWRVIESLHLDGFLG